jgi:5-methylcytosine-specific restriction endonuclease McrA
MAKKKPKKYNLRSRLTSAIRRVWLYSPHRNQILKDAKAAGNKCNICKKPQEKLEVDHVKPTVKLSGWDGDWTFFINTMFEGEMVALCKNCHQAKTALQRETRKKLKKALEE